MAWLSLGMPRSLTIPLLLWSLPAYRTHLPDIGTAAKIWLSGLKVPGFPNCSFLQLNCGKTDHPIMDRQTELCHHLTSGSTSNIPSPKGQPGRAGSETQGRPAVKIPLHWLSCQGSSTGSCVGHEHTRSCRHQRALGSHQATPLRKC